MDHALRGKCAPGVIAAVSAYLGSSKFWNEKLTVRPSGWVRADCPTPREKMLGKIEKSYRLCSMKSVCMGKVDAFYLGESFSGVFSLIGRGKRDRIMIRPTRVPRGVSRVNRQNMSHYRKKTNHKHTHKQTNKKAIFNRFLSASSRYSIITLLI